MASIYEEAFDRLIDAIDRETILVRRAIQPFISLFRGTEKYLENGGELTSKQRDALRLKFQVAERRFPKDREVIYLIASIRRLTTLT
jgi:hypothetical protein